MKKAQKQGKGHVNGCQYSQWELIKAPCSCFEKRLRLRATAQQTRPTQVAIGVRRAMLEG